MHIVVDVFVDELNVFESLQNQSQSMEVAVFLACYVFLLKLRLQKHWQNLLNVTFHENLFAGDFGN